MIEAEPHAASFRKIERDAVVPRADRARALELSREVLQRWAATVDRENRFPHEAVSMLRRDGFLGWFVPTTRGVREGSLVEFCRIAAILGEGCTATAIVWTMHCQQVAVLARHAAQTHAATLRGVGRGDLIASVTSEYGKGGELLVATSPLQYEGEDILLRRSAPVVSYGEHADVFLITMLRRADAPPTDVALVAVEANAASAVVNGSWDAAGMRGTRSVPMTFDARLPSRAILPGHFREIALMTMVPVGHLGWASSWYGAARGALTRLINVIRSSRGAARQKLTSELFIHRVGEIRLQLDLLEALIDRTAQQLEELWARDAPLQAFEDLELSIRINNVKAAGARLSFTTANALIELAGLAHGYLRDSETGIERVFRDLRSATLMFHDDRLLAANGRLALMAATSQRVPGAGA